MPLPKTATLAVPLRSHKCGLPIDVAGGPLRDALIWAILDGSVNVISLECVTFTTPARRMRFAVLDGLKVLDVVAAPSDTEARRRNERAWRAYGWTPLTLSAAEIRRETRFVNARSIWRHAGADVPADLRIQVAGALGEGPLHLDELLNSLRADRDPLPAVFAMVCEGEIEIDLGGTLGPTTTVRSRS